MTWLTDSQWERCSLLIQQLKTLSIDALSARLRSLQLQGKEDADILSYVATHFALPPEPDRSHKSERIGNYKLGELIAYGGMGIVYRARHSELERDVAFKLIDPRLLLSERDEVIRRFKKEIKTLAKLDSKRGIVTIHDGGTYTDPITGETPYCVMQLIDGAEPITRFAGKQQLSANQRLVLFVKVCDAINIAHSYNIVHRDLKPANIVVDRDGEPYVIDFGLAQILDPSIPQEQQVLSSGTPAYMSPEHVSEDHEIGFKSDVYTLGLILYELLTDHLPYEVQPKSLEAIRKPILNAKPLPIGTYNSVFRGSELEQFVAKALAKNPNQRCTLPAFKAAIERYLTDDTGHKNAAALTQESGTASAKQRSTALLEPRTIRTLSVAMILLMLTVIWLKPWDNVERQGMQENAIPPTSERPTIAVLPFTNLSSDPEEEYFADGMTTDLITDLSKILGLAVIARNSVFTYKGKAVNVPQVGRELNVRYVLEGSVRRAGGKFRVNVQLIDARNGRHLWAERYDRDYQDIFAVQDEVIAEVVSAISVKLTDREQTRIAQLPTDNLEAYDAYLRAEQSLYISGADALADTLSLYEKAIALDPEFADAYAGFARAAVETWRLDYSQLLSSAVARKRAYEAAARALVLDPSNSRAYSVLAVLQLVDRHHDTAIQSARKAVSFAPGDADAHLNLGFVLAHSGRPTEARVAVEAALRLNPKPAPGALFLAGVAFFMDGHYARTAEVLEQVLSAHSIAAEDAQLYLVSTYAHLDQTSAAKATLAALSQQLPMVNRTYYRVRENYYKRKQDLDTLIDGLRKGGMPEWPYGFQGNEEDRLDESALRAVSLGHTWMGRHMNGVHFVQQISQTGVIAYRSPASLLTGIVEVRGDMLCRQFEGYLLDQKLCGHVYRNPDGSRENNNEYISVMPDSLKFFSIMQ